MEHKESEQYVEFDIGQQKYAVIVSEIHEIIRMLAVTEMPDMPSFVKGVVNLRGTIVPVISLRLLFGLSDDTVTKFTRIIVVHNRNAALGVIVDKVNKVLRFADIQPPPKRFGGLSDSYFAGIGVNDGGLTGILKLKEVLMQE